MVKVIISMSGFGERFRKAGYNLPKPLIEVDGKPMIEHVVNMFPGATSFVFICNREHLETTNMRDVCNSIVKNCSIVSIEPHKLGPVYAVSKAYDYINDDEEIIISYCDFGSYWSFFNFMVDSHHRKLDACVVSYRGFHPHMLGSDNYAFIKTHKDDDMILEEIQEKKPYTNNKMQEWASNGVYYFKKGSYVKKYFTQLITEDKKVNGEFYVSMVYNLLKKDGLKIGIFPIQHMLQWGTPYDLDVYNQWSLYFKRIITPKKIISNPKNTITILPMAGKGSRFSMKGYTRPKPLLDVNGYPMFFQAVDCLPSSESTTWITLREHCEQYPEVEKTIKEHFDSSKIIKLDSVTEGQACTCYEAIKDIDDETPILITACDNASYWDSEEYKKLLDDTTNDVIVWSFKHNPTSKNNPNMYSWLEVYGNKILKAHVKNCIFDNPYEENAIIGTFFYRKAKFFKEAYLNMVQKNIRTGNEFYVDNMLNESVELGRNVVNFSVMHYICWGIPDEYETYKYWRSYFHKTINHPYRIYNDSTFNKLEFNQIISENKCLVVKQKEECCICPHQGWGDIVVATPMIQFLASIYSKLYIIIRNDGLPMINFIKQKIQEQIQGSDIVIIPCEKDISEKSEIQKLEGVHFIGIGIWNEKISSSYPFLSNVKVNVHNVLNNAHYTHHFYMDYMMDCSIRANYMIHIDQKVNNEFVCIHEDHKRGMIINRDNIKSKNEIVSFNGNSNIVFDMIGYMKTAEECHFINSIYMLLAYHYNISYGEITCPIYLHLYSRDRHDTNSFLYPSIDNLFMVN